MVTDSSSAQGVPNFSPSMIFLRLSPPSTILFYFSELSSVKYLQLWPLLHTVMFHFLCLFLHLISDLFFSNKSPPLESSSSGIDHLYLYTHVQTAGINGLRWIKERFASGMSRPSPDLFPPSILLFFAYSSLSACSSKGMFPIQALLAGRGGGGE